MIPIYILLLTELVLIVRLVRGPTSLDRLLAANAFSTVLILMMLMMFDVFRYTILFDIGIILLLLTFAGTTVFTLYMRKEK